MWPAPSVSGPTCTAPRDHRGGPTRAPPPAPRPDNNAPNHRAAAARRAEMEETGIRAAAIFAGGGRCGALTQRRASPSWGQTAPLGALGGCGAGGLRPWKASRCGLAPASLMAAGVRPLPPPGSRGRLSGDPSGTAVGASCTRRHSRLGSTPVAFNRLLARRKHVFYLCLANSKGLGN